MMKALIIGGIILFVVFSVMLTLACCATASNADRREEKYLEENPIEDADFEEEP